MSPYWTVRRLYERWVYECGYIADSKGRDLSYGKTEIYQLRPNDQFWSEGSEPTQVVSKATFRKIWKTKFKDIKIGSIAKDTCGTCWVFKCCEGTMEGAKLEGERVIDEQNLEEDSIDFAATNMEVDEDELEDNE